MKVNVIIAILHVCFKEKGIFKALYNEILEFKNKDYLVKQYILEEGRCLPLTYFYKNIKQIYSKFLIDKNAEITN